MADRVVAFARETPDDCVALVVGRHLAPFVPSAEGPAPHSWEDTSLSLPERLGGIVYDVLTGREIHASAGAVSAKELFSILPAAALVGRARS